MKKGTMSTIAECPRQREEIVTTAAGQRRRLRRIGPEQERLLEELRTHGPWRRDANWTWRVPSMALRLLGSLERRGLVERDGEAFRLTQRGLVETTRNSEELSRRRCAALWGMRT